MRSPPQLPAGPFELLHPPTRDALVAEIGKEEKKGGGGHDEMY